MHPEYPKILKNIYEPFLRFRRIHGKTEVFCGFLQNKIEGVNFFNFIFYVNFFRTHIFLNLGEIFFSISSKLTILFENFKILHICIFFGLFQKACWKVAFIYLFQCGFKRWFQNWFQISPATNGSHARAKNVLYFEHLYKIFEIVWNTAPFLL